MRDNKNLDFLDQYRDTEGLISTKLIQLDKNGNMSLENQKVETPFQIENIVEILINDEYLWSITKIYLEKKRKGIWCRSGAPIIGVPFSVGLQNAINGKREGYSLFSIEECSIEKGLSGSLCAHYNSRKKDNEIDFQLWEIVLPIDTYTYFIHGIYDLKDNSFSHFDGALIDLDVPTREKMLRSPHIPDKKFNYQKLFKLDGKVSIENAMQLMHSYLPIEKLSLEYGINATTIMETTFDKK